MTATLDSTRRPSLNDPFSVGDRTLVAKTCTKCWQLKDAKDFGMKSGRRHSWCLECKGALNHAYNRSHLKARRAYRARPEVQERKRAHSASPEAQEVRRAYRARNRDYLAQQKAEHKQRMHADIPQPNNQRVWTAEEEATVMRDDITLIEMCYMLGRSYSAVKARRRFIFRGRRREA